MTLSAPQIDPRVQKIIARIEAAMVRFNREEFEEIRIYIAALANMPHKSFQFRSLVSALMAQQEARGTDPDRMLQALEGWLREDCDALEVRRKILEERKMGVWQNGIFATGAATVLGIAGILSNISVKLNPFVVSMMLTALIVAFYLRWRSSEKEIAELKTHQGLTLFLDDVRAEIARRRKKP